MSTVYGKIHPWMKLYFLAKLIMINCFIINLIEVDIVAARAGSSR